MNTLEGNLIAKGLKIGIVGARFNAWRIRDSVGGKEDGRERQV